MNSSARARRASPLRMPRLCGAGACLAALALAPALAAQSALEIVASVYPLELMLRELGGEQVSTLLPPGVSPHHFEPRPSDVIRLAKADVFLMMGGGVDDWTQRLVAVAPATLESSSLHALAAEADASLGSHPWLDPLTVRDRLAPALTRFLIAIDPVGESRYRARARAFARALTALDRELRSTLAAAPGRHYVAFHDAWRDFAQRYALEQVGVVEKFPGEEATPRELAALIVAARESGVTAVLVEPQLDPRIASVIGAEFGAGVVLVDPLGNPEDPRHASYAGLIRFNAAAFARALGGAGS